MEKNIKNILEQEAFTKEDPVTMLRSEGIERTLLFQKSSEIKEKYIGNKVWFRGLIELSAERIVFIAESGKGIKTLSDIIFQMRRYLMLQGSHIIAVTDPLPFSQANWKARL